MIFCDPVPLSGLTMVFCNKALLGNNAMKNKAVVNIGCNKRSNSKSVFWRYISTRVLRRKVLLAIL
jgi:hypothetical protein